MVVVKARFECSGAGPRLAVSRQSKTSRREA
jgi:hypothetical protein